MTDNDITVHDHGIALPLPQARTPIEIRSATLNDLPFIDALQKMHTHMVGFFPRKQMESYVEGGHVLIAEEVGIKASRHQGNKATWHQGFRGLDATPGGDATMPFPSAMSSRRTST
jgi:hypothetical protein